MYKVVATPLFEREWPNYWMEREHTAFLDFIAQNPLAGVVVPHSGGVRKVRWRRAGIGKSGGVRIVYFVRKNRELIFLLKIYSKARTESVSPAELKRIRNAIEE